MGTHVVRTVELGVVKVAVVQNSVPIHASASPHPGAHFAAAKIKLATNQ